MSELNLKPEDIDRLGQALLTITQELWVVKDRVKVLEQALVDSGVMPPGAVDQLQPDEELKAELADERAVLINQILKALEKT